MGDGPEGRQEVRFLGPISVNLDTVLERNLDTVLERNLDTVLERILDTVLERIYLNNVTPRGVYI